MGRFIMTSVVVLLLICGGVAVNARYSKGAGERVVRHSASFETYYDESTSVYCATRANAVSCVYVPRDTVR